MKKKITSLSLHLNKPLTFKIVKNAKSKDYVHIINKDVNLEMIAHKKYIDIEIQSFMEMLIIEYVFNSSNLDDDAKKLRRKLIKLFI